MMTFLSVNGEILLFYFNFFIFIYVKVITVYSIFCVIKELIQILKLFRDTLVHLSTFFGGMTWAIWWKGSQGKNVLKPLFNRLINGISFAYIGQYHYSAQSFSFSYLTELMPTQKIWFHLSHTSHWTDLSSFWISILHVSH